jgi:hypothetical protein
MNLQDTIITFALNMDLTLPMTSAEYTALAKVASKAMGMKPLKVKETTTTERRKYRYTVEVKDK